MEASELFFGVSITAAFLGGMVALFAPCCLTFLFPSYLGTIFQAKGKVFFLTLVFALGIASILVPVALGFRFVVSLFDQFHTTVYLLGSLLLISLGIMVLMDVSVLLPFLPALRMPKKVTVSSVFLLGVFSGITSSCCAPVLFAAITLSSLSPTLFASILVSFSYVFGIVTPLFLLSLLYDRVTNQYLSKLKKKGERLLKILAAATFIGSGIVIAFLTLTNRIGSMDDNLSYGKSLRSLIYTLSSQTTTFWTDILIAFLFVAFLVFLLVELRQVPSGTWQGQVPSGTWFRFKKGVVKRFFSDRYVLGFVAGFLLAMLVFVLIPRAITKMQGGEKVEETVSTQAFSEDKREKLAEAVLPKNGVRLGVTFGDVVTKMVEAGVIDQEKFLALYKDRGGLPQEFASLLKSPSSSEVVLTRENANILLNFLWAFGLSNKTAVLSEGPMGTTYKDQVSNFASTGGWTLGREDGGALFNRFEFLVLTPAQEGAVATMAKNIFRSCCGNSTYFPDCNHGAAMLGFLELAVSQGMSEDDIYKKALALNAFWFPNTYVDLAVYFAAKEGKSWPSLTPKMLLGQQYSSGQGYQAVRKEMQAMNLLPETEGGASCGV